MARARGYHGDHAQSDYGQHPRKQQRSNIFTWRVNQKRTVVPVYKEVVVRMVEAATVVVVNRFLRLVIRNHHVLGDGRVLRELRRGSCVVRLIDEVPRRVTAEEQCRQHATAYVSIPQHAAVLGSVHQQRCTGRVVCLPNRTADWTTKCQLTSV